MALSYSKIEVEIKEILLKNRPDELYSISPKGTVPVLHLGEDFVIEESLDIMKWSIEFHDPNNWVENDYEKQLSLIYSCDNNFKYWLDRYKYSDRYPDYDINYYRLKCNVFLDKLEKLLEKNNYFYSNQILLCDIAIFPFIRQFAHVDQNWFNEKYKNLSVWLNDFLESKIFKSVMYKYLVYKNDQEPLITNFNNI